MSEQQAPGFDPERSVRHAGITQVRWKDAGTRRARRGLEDADDKISRRIPTNHGIRLREARAVSVHFADGTVSIRRSRSPKRAVVTGEHRSQGDKRGSARCALCGSSLTGKNATREHVLPNAIGGRKKVRNFLCVVCNSTTGNEWDSELVEQLRPLCTMLNVSRERGENRRFDVESVGGKRLTLKPDGSMTIAEPRFEKEEVDGGTAVKIQARTMRELRKMLAGLKKDHPEMDVDELMKQAEWVRQYANEAYAVSLNVGGLVAGRSMIKSCLAMVYDAGLEIGNCEEAERFLLKGGPPCFHLYTGRDLVSERPERTFFHYVHVRGDPNRRQLIAYVEYFGSWRYLARLSKNYDGHAFSHCYAVDPLSGKEVNLDVMLEIEPADYEEMNEGGNVDFGKVVSNLKVLMGAWREMDVERARSEAINDAVAFAWETCGIEEGEILSEEQTARLARAISDRLEPNLLHLILGSRLTEDDLRAIERKSKGGSQ